MDFRTTTQGSNKGPVENAGGAKQTNLSVSAVVRLEVLSVDTAAAAGALPSRKNPPAPAIHLRATYEKATATVQTDSFDPQAATLEQQYRALAGRSLEFTLGASGGLSLGEGFQKLFPDERAAAAAQRWLSSLTLAASLPQRGIAIGDKWSGDMPVTATPLAGLVLRTHSTYLRNESCQPPALAKLAQPAGPQADETCAVIATAFEMDRRHAPRDPTPPDYRQEGLRTSGRITSSGQNLSYISLRTGWVVSVTGKSLEEMDVTISAAQSGSNLRYTSQVRGESQITLLEETKAATSDK